MFHSSNAKLPLTLMIVGALTFATEAVACESVGIVKRSDFVSGSYVLREDSKRPARVLSPICDGDVLEARGRPLTLTLYGRGDRTLQDGERFRVSSRRERASYVSNFMDEAILRTQRDMSHIDVEAVSKGSGGAFGFAISKLADVQRVEATKSYPELLIRLVGGAGPYSGQLTDAAGTTLSATNAAAELIFPTSKLVVGTARLTVGDGEGKSLTATIEISPSTPPDDRSYAGVDDAETRAALQAVDLARDSQGLKSLEAEQKINAAPKSGLDRETVFALIEGY